MTVFSRTRRRCCLFLFLAYVALYTWTVFGFPSEFHLTPTTFARGFILPLSSSAKNIFRRDGHRSFANNDVLEKPYHLRTDDSQTVSLSTSTAPSYEKEIREFLASKCSDPSSLLEQFHVQGWRWHTKSLARDARRLRKLAMKTNTKSTESLKHACDYVVGFNMMGLHKIETDLFFPWMREKLTVGFPEKQKLSTSFSSAMDFLETDRWAVAQLGQIISKKALVACNTQASESRRSSAIFEIAEHSAELENLVQRMITTEDSLLVPSIGAIVSVREQKSFNNKVLRKLGLLDSRLHLVGMYEAVWEDNDSNEKELFQQAIPGISRKMIPRWKRKLYQPKTFMME